MNEKALIHFINRHLGTFVHLCSPTGFLLESCPPFQKTHDEFIQWTQLLTALTDFSETECPRIISVNAQVVYASVKAPETLYLIGPVRLDVPTAFRLALHNPNIKDSWMDAVPLCNFNLFIETVLMLHNFYAPQFLRNDILALHNYDASGSEKEIQTVYSDILFERQENERLHNPYGQEVRLLESIASGDLDSLAKCWWEEDQQSYGTLSPQPLRNVKNLCVAVITLASRAAIRGGVSPETAFSLCDSYVQRLENCTESMTCAALVHEAQKYYAQLVSNLHRGTNSATQLRPTPHLSKCKDYIYSHLHERINIQDIADFVHLNVTYLSDLFKKYEGCTIHQFILAEKIALVKNLLKYSTYTYSEIATYLGFSSQSHLGVQFKKITGYTLREYRVKYGAGKVYA
jgi:AraC-like DNA-binding protein